MDMLNRILEARDELIEETGCNDSDYYMSGVQMLCVVQISKDTINMIMNSSEFVDKTKSIAIVNPEWKEIHEEITKICDDSIRIHKRVAAIFDKYGNKVSPRFKLKSVDEETEEVTVGGMVVDSDGNKTELSQKDIAQIIKIIGTSKINSDHDDDDDEE